MEFLDEEEVTQIDRSLEVVPQVILERLDGLNSAFEAYGTLCAIQELVKDKEVIDPVSKRLAKIAIENVKLSLDIFKDGTTIAVESMDDSCISVEGFKETLKGIWDAIVRTFKSIWVYINSFFKSSKQKANLQEAKDVVSSAVSDIKKAASNDSAPTSEQKETTGVDSVLTEKFKIAIGRFGFMKDPITLADLLEQLAMLEATISSCSTLTKSLEICNVNAIEAVKELERSNGQLTDSVNGYAASIVVSYFDAIGSCFNNHEDIYPYREQVKEKFSLKYHELNKQTTGALTGFTRGVKIFAFQENKQQVDDILYKFIITKEPTDSKEQLNKLYFTSLEEVQEYGEGVATLLDSLIDLIAQYEVSSKRVYNSNETLLEKMDKAIIASGNDNALVQRHLGIYKAIINVLGTTVTSLNTFIVAVDKSATDHLDLLKTSYPIIKATVESSEQTA